MYSVYLSSIIRLVLTNELWPSVQHDINPKVHIGSPIQGDFTLRNYMYDINCIPGSKSNATKLIIAREDWTVIYVAYKALD